MIKVYKIIVRFENPWSQITYMFKNLTRSLDSMICYGRPRPIVKKVEWLWSPQVSYLNLYAFISLTTGFDGVQF